MSAVLRACLLGVFLLLIISQPTVEAIGASTFWWSLGVTDCGLKKPTTPCPTCARFRSDRILSESQASQCISDPEPVKAIASGSRSAIIECQAQFKDRQWNCSTFFSEYLFGKFIAEDSTRETGILQAYFAAGAVKGVATACHSQRITGCACALDGPVESSDEQGNVIYRTCSENTAYAINYVLNFIFPGLKVTYNTSMYHVVFTINKDNGGNIYASIDKQPLPTNGSSPAAVESTASTQSYTRVLNDVHNTVVGLKAINKTSQECVCHGLSGTCSVQTCYTKIKEVSEIGDELSHKYGGAIKVVKQANSTKLLNAYPGRNNPSENDLVYINESPNFCRSNLSRGILGTKDRLCKPNGDGPDSCQNLCCSHGFYTLSYTVPKETCRFVWCCRIVCESEGDEQIVEHRCNGPPSNQG